MHDVKRARRRLAAVGAFALTFGIAAPAFADYAPGPGDVVGVGSDTVQYASDFIADGDFLGDGGFNSAGNVNRIINFDATPDANARLAYGPGGAAGVTAGQCSPGDGATQGTGNQTTTHADAPCTLNPTIVLRAGLQPVQRPNGSGAGFALLKADTSESLVNYARSSSTQDPETGYDSIQIGNDNLEMLETNTPTSHAVPLSIPQLKAIYTCTDTTWTQVGGTSSDTIIPILPQVGSGTRKTFLLAINSSTTTQLTPGSCVINAEENDPTALNSTTSPADAIEPMSSGRLNLFKGILGTGGSNGYEGYFLDPSCSAKITSTNCPATPNVINPDVKFITGSPSDGNAIYNQVRGLYIYFRDSDINSTKVFEPGGTLNYVRTLFYNPCSGSGCTGFGPGGAPYYDTTAGQALISAAGIDPTYVFTANGP